MVLVDCCAFGCSWDAVLLVTVNENIEVFGSWPFDSKFDVLDFK